MWNWAQTVLRQASVCPILPQSYLWTHVRRRLPPLMPMLRVNRTVLCLFRPDLCLASRRVLAALSPCGLPGDASQGVRVSSSNDLRSFSGRACLSNRFHSLQHRGRYDVQCQHPELRQSVWIVTGSKDRHHNSTSEQEGHYLIQKQHARRCQRRAVSRVPVEEGSQRDLQLATAVAVKLCGRHFRLDFLSVSAEQPSSSLSDASPLARVILNQSATHSACYSIGYPRDFQRFSALVGEMGGARGLQ